MSEPYPLPGYAASIWITSAGTLAITTPDGKIEALPTTAFGMTKLVQTLRQRRHDYDTGGGKTRTWTQQKPEPRWTGPLKRYDTKGRQIISPDELFDEPTNHQFP